MFERMMCIVVSLISLVSVFFAGQQIEITQENEYAVRSNYVDVSFTTVQSENGSAVFLTDDHKKISYVVGDNDTIQYELYNNSLSYDVEVVVLVNGQKTVQDENLHITTSDIGELKSGERKTGTIEIKYENTSLEDRNIPLNIELQIQPIQKEYLA